VDCRASAGDKKKSLTRVDAAVPGRIRVLPAPGVVRTWSPRGVTPRLRAPLTREHVSLVGAVTPDGR